MILFCCPECENTQFKKEYDLEYGYIWYCTRCGRIMLNSDIYEDEYKSWKQRHYRPNAWDDCFVNNIYIYVGAD